MAQLANTVMTIPAYISNDAASTSITVTDPISGAKTLVYATGYYEFVLNDGTGTGTRTDPYHALKLLSAATTTNWLYSLGNDGRITIEYIGTGTATFVFATTHVRNLFGFTSSTLTFSGAGSQTATYPVFGVFLSKSRKGDSSWRHVPGHSVYQITPGRQVIGWNDGNDKQVRSFTFDFLPKDQNNKTSGMVSTPAYPVSASEWNTTPTALSYTPPYTALRFAKETQGELIKLYLGPIPYNGTSTYFNVYQTPDSIKKSKRFPPSISGNETYLSYDEVEVLEYSSDSGEALYATGSLVASFSPTSVSGLYAWYRGDLVTYDGSNKVSVWPDKSGNGNHLSQSNSVKQPVYSASISSRNNQPGIHATGGAYLQAENFALRTYKTIFIVVGSTGSMSYVSSLYNGGVEYYYTYHPGPATFYNRDNSAVAHYITNFGANFFQANTNHTFEYDGVTPTLYRSSSNVAGTVVGSATADNYATGSFSLFSGWSGGSPSTIQILEVIIYNKTLNSTERTQIWNYFAARYGS